MLAARAAGSERVDAQVVRVEVEIHFLGLGQDGDRGGRGVHAALRFGFGHALDAVHAALELEAGIHLVARDAEHDLLVAAEFGLGGAHDLGLPAAFIRVHGVHAVQVGGEQRAFLAARAAADLHENVFLVVRVLGQEQDLELVLEPRDVSLGLLELFLRQLFHVRVGQHLERVLLRLLCFFIGAERRDDRLELVALLEELGRPVGIVVQPGFGEARFQLVHALGKGFQFLKHIGLFPFVFGRPLVGFALFLHCFDDQTVDEVVDRFAVLFGKILDLFSCTFGHNERDPVIGFCVIFVRCALLSFACFHFFFFRHCQHLAL